MQNTYVKKLNTLRTSRRLHKHSNTSPGFTIVELLIVIVVIAILAAISITAYTNFQQRAKNTAIINAASQSLKMIQAYIVEYGTYPAKNWSCITSETGCQASPGTDDLIAPDSTFNTNMEKIGTLPKSVPSEGARLYGVAYVYNSAAMFNEVSQPAYLQYHLFGQNQQCGVSGVMRWIGHNTYDSSAVGYYSYSSTYDKTLCLVNIPGPEHS